jgi:hypothetical protein
MQEEELGELRKGEILCRAIFISVDPITRWGTVFFQLVN